MPVVPGHDHGVADMCDAPQPPPLSREEQAAIIVQAVIDEFGADAVRAALAEAEPDPGRV